VALKFCGGCNPDYDRVSVAESIRTGLEGRVEFRSTADCSGIDIVLVLAGCQTACADLSAFEDCEAILIHSAEDADREVAAIRSRQEKGRRGAD
jgi:hypothetical protein